MVRYRIIGLAGSYKRTAKPCVPCDVRYSTGFRTISPKVPKVPKKRKFFQFIQAYRVTLTRNAYSTVSVHTINNIPIQVSIDE